MKKTLKTLDKKAGEHYSKAKVFFRMGRYEEALQASEDAETVWRQMADLLSENGEEGEKQKILGLIFEVRSSAGMALFKMDRYEEALEVVDEALKAKPESPTEWSNRGFVLSALGRYEEALEAFDKSLALNPDSTEALTSKGVVFFRTGQPEKALEAFDAALAVVPKEASDWACKLPRFSFFSRNKAPVLRPNKAEPWYWKGRVFESLGEKEKALEAYKKALESNPEHLNSLLSGGALLCEFKEYKEAFKCYTKALKLSPGNPAAKAGKEICEENIQ
ncbi:MAG: tetratricopeptide repeat protein [Methanosarcinaceae archaeon]|nr:tetratricopeptide repeat protein [Methanosarcinaceae archaeon]